MLILTLWPEVNVPGPEGSDKGAHLVSFGWLMVWFSQVVVKQRWRLVLALVFYGGLIELLQHFSGYRYGDIWDLCADSAGVMLAWGLVTWVMPNWLDRIAPSCD
ncbi:MAG: VanZ family protein [Immundisolibacteraceae bacterium]|nr:VanZ family protein [Immundisolibacteraceae bacterium]